LENGKIPSTLGEVITGDLLVVSDVHLRGPEDVRCVLLSNLLGKVRAGSVKTVLLLGDIFDFCIGGPPYYRERYQKLIEILERVAGSGTRVIFLEGNHEFSMDRMKWKGVEIVSREALVLEILTGGDTGAGNGGAGPKNTRLAIRHGDLLHAPWSYQIFRRVLKSAFVCGVARAVPPRIMEAYALSHAKVSRARDPYRVIDHQQLLEAAEAWVGVEDAQHGVFGHFHVPYAEKRKNGSGFILSLRAWDEPNFLLFSGGVFSRGVYDNSTGEWLQTPAISYFSP